MARRIWEDAMKAAKAHSEECSSATDPVPEQQQPRHSMRFVHAEVIKTVKLDKYLQGTFALQYNFDGSLLAAGFGGGGVKLFDPLTGKILKELRPNRHGGYAVMCLRWHPRQAHLLYACTAEGHVYLLNTDNLDATHVITEVGNEINCMDFSMDGYTFATSGKSLDVHIYQTKSNKLMRKYEGNRGTRGNPDLEGGNTMRVFALKYTPHNENVFISAGWDNHIKIWDQRTNDGICRQIHGPHICGDSLDMQDKYILAGSWCANHALQVFEYGEGTLMREIDFPSTKGAFLYCAQYCDHNVVLAGGSGTNSACALEVFPGETKPKTTVNNLLTVQFEHPVQALDSANGGRLFAVGGGDPNIKLCKMSSTMAT